jgi:hypothetical protein
MNGTSAIVELSSSNAKHRLRTAAIPHTIAADGNFPISLHHWRESARKRARESGGGKGGKQAAASNGNFPISLHRHGERKRETRSQRYCRRQTQPYWRQRKRWKREREARRRRRRRGGGRRMRSLPFACGVQRVPQPADFPHHRHIAVCL